MDFLCEQAHQEGTLREFSQKTTLSLEKASEIAERLWFDGMICRGGNPPGWRRGAKEDPFGIPLTLTPFAVEILNDPEGSEKWLNGRVFDPYRPQSRLRAALTGAIRAPVSLFFLVSIFTVFAIGLYLCSGTWQRAVDYLKPDETDPNVAAVFDGLGLETGEIWDEGHWWVPLQANLVHLGVLHLAMNSLVLWRLGGHVERVYGSLPYFLIGLASAWLGGCAALAWYPYGGAGASAALSGVIAADGVWFLSNRKMLSRRIHFLWGQQVTVNLALLFAISLMAKVSASGHFGGALAGALISWSWLGISPRKQRVSARVLRSIGTLCAVGVGGFLLVENARANWATWDHYRELKYFQPLTDRFLKELLNPLIRMHEREIVPLQGMPPLFRQQGRIDTIAKKLEKLRSISEELRPEWKAVPHSARQDRPELTLALFDAIDVYIDENISYLQTGLRPDWDARNRRQVAWERLMELVHQLFVMKENQPDDESKNEKEN